MLVRELLLEKDRHPYLKKARLQEALSPDNTKHPYLQRFVLRSSFSIWNTVIEILRDNIIAPFAGKRQPLTYSEQRTPPHRQNYTVYSSQSSLWNTAGSSILWLRLFILRHPKRIAFLEFWHMFHTRRNLHVTTMHHRTGLRITKIATSSFPPHHTFQDHDFYTVDIEPLLVGSKFSIKPTLIAVIDWRIRSKGILLCHRQTPTASNAFGF